MEERPIEIRTTGGSFAWIEAPQAGRRTFPESITRLVKAAYAVWGEENWIVRRVFSNRFPTDRYLERIQVPWAKEELERGFLRFFSMRRKVLTMLFEDPEDCTESLRTDYPDEWLLVLQAYLCAEFPNPEQVVHTGVEDVFLFDLKSVAEGKSFATLLFDPRKGIGRVFAGDDSVLRLRTVLANSPLRE